MDNDILFCLCTCRHCGVRNPSWAELHHFVGFLSTQLRNFERTDFCQFAAEEDLPGFAKFVLQFLITMSRVSVDCLNQQL